MAARLDTARPDGTPVTLETFTQTRYRCPGCRRSWSSSSLARLHVEGGCRRDPANRGCRSCRNFYPGEDPGYESGGCEPYCKVDVPAFRLHHPADDTLGFESRAWTEIVEQMGCPSWVGWGSA